MQTPVTDAEITQVVQQIAARFQPRRVFLFGSYAYGKATADSDVDLLVEMETSLRGVEQAVEIRRAIDLPFPTDLLVRTPDQVAERLAMGDVFLREIVSKGRLVYEATNV